MPSKTTSSTVRKKRKCWICNKTLADLNPNKNLCFAHDQRYPQYKYLPVTGCTSYNKMVPENSNYGSDGAPVSPGSENYNYIAFIRVLIYPDFNQEV